MKLLFIGEHAGFSGGIERHMFRSAALLREQGIRVSLLYREPDRGRDEFLAGFDSSATWNEIPPAGSFDCAVIHKLRDPAMARHIIDSFRTVSFLHDHEYWCPRRSLYYPGLRRNCMMRHTRLFCGLCGMLRSGSGGAAAAARDSFFTVPELWKEIRRSSALAVLSGFMRSRACLMGADESRIRLVPPEIQLPERTSSAVGDCPSARILCAGQLIRGKGVDQLLAALPYVSGEFVLDILGSGKDEKLLRRMAAPFGAKVQFTPWTNTPEQFFSRASAAVLPWRWQEPFGLVGPEALSYGVPLAGFDVGGIREYLIDGDTGFLADPGDIRGLAEILSRLIAESETRMRLGANGRALVACRYSAEAAVNGWLQLLGDFKA